MHTLKATILVGALAIAAPASAQSHDAHAAQHGGNDEVVAALANDVRQAEQKLIGLAEAIPEDRWSWRPAEGVRSIGEVFLHIAADNYFIPAMAGNAAPASTGIVGTDYNTAVAFETRALDKAATIAALRESFVHLHQVMAGVDHDDLMAQLSFFGNQMSGLQLWVLNTTHLHEHLGQSIAYARSNGIVPPWSRGD
jgi:uncharacterized damage-inducible protein DinB